MRGSQRRWTVAVAAVLMGALALVAYDVGPAPEASRAHAEPVRNATIVIEQGGARRASRRPT